MFVTYLTVYSGDKLPAFYIGSTTAERIASGYHGSVRSSVYRDVWASELKEHPELFETRVLTKHETRNESLDEEERIQKLFDVVRSSLFVNKAYARGGFINPGSFSDEVRAVMSRKAKARGMSEAVMAAGRAARTGMKDSEEVKTRRNASVSIGKKASMGAMTPEERKAKFGKNGGKPWSAARRAAHNASKEN
jgi:hypothetical protein